MRLGCVLTLPVSVGYGGLGGKCGWLIVRRS